MSPNERDDRDAADRVPWYEPGHLLYGAHWLGVVLVSLVALWGSVLWRGRGLERTLRRSLTLGAVGLWVLGVGALAKEPGLRWRFVAEEADRTDATGQLRKAM